jgi:hypothetical protein
MNVARIHPPEIHAAGATAAGGLVGAVVAQHIVSALGTRCGTVEELYGVCRPHALVTPWAVLIYLGFVVAGALLGWTLRVLFSPTLKRFVGAGTVELREIGVRGDGARIEWDAQGGISVSDLTRSGFVVRSPESAGQARLPAGRYRFRVTAPGPWTLRVARG